MGFGLRGQPALNGLIVLSKCVSLSSIDCVLNSTDTNFTVSYQEVTTSRQLIEVFPPGSPP